MAAPVLVQYQTAPKLYRNTPVLPLLMTAAPSKPGIAIAYEVADPLEHSCSTLQYNRPHRVHASFLASECIDVTLEQNTSCGTPSRGTVLTSMDKLVERAQLCQSLAYFPFYNTLRTDPTDVKIDLVLGKKLDSDLRQYMAELPPHQDDLVLLVQKETLALNTQLLSVYASLVGIADRWLVKPFLVPQQPWLLDLNGLPMKITEKDYELLKCYPAITAAAIDKMISEDLHRWILGGFAWARFGEEPPTQWQQHENRTFK